MSEVLYRKWRPRTFGDVVGQHTTTQTLQRAVESDRVAHAYLFCGPRGTGKTSTARILAKAVNCLSDLRGEPDNSCAICVSIDEGRALDLIEIDAASNRGIDDIRNLRERVQYSPSEAKFKVYIVDEAHMLTEHAFNALLKTLEEPPPHVVFILATTEVHKIPPTISSRCQRFDFRRITADDISGRLRTICKSEVVETESDALQLIAKTADGGLRDAVNLLEQVMVSYDPPITQTNVRDLLDIGDDEVSLTLAVQLLDGRTAEALRTLNDVAAQGSDLRQLQRGLIDHLRSALLVSCGAELDSEYTEEAASQIRNLTEKISVHSIIRAIKILTTQEVRQDSASTLPLELAIVEVGLRPLGINGAETSPSGEARQPNPSDEVPSSRKSRREQERPSSDTSKSIPASPNRPPVSNPEPMDEATKESDQSDMHPRAEADLPSEPEARLDAQWETLTSSLRFVKGDKFNLKALLVASNGREVSADSITLKFPHTSHKERMEQELEVPSSRKLLRDAFARVMGKPYDVLVETSQVNITNEDPKAGRNSPLVRAAQAMGAQIVSNTLDEQRDSEVRS